jgi:hypothetical protein
VEQVALAVVEEQAVITVVQVEQEEADASFCITKRKG